MAKSKKVFTCFECDYIATNWLGRCPECGEWNSIEESSQINLSNSSISNLQNTPVNIVNIKEENLEKYRTGITEFDRVIGDGLTKGSLTLLGGNPGVGKSTLLMKLTHDLLLKNKEIQSILYVSGEETINQIAQRSKKHGDLNNGLYLLNETNWQNILSQIVKLKPSIMVLDSIQTTISNEVAAMPGSITQVREVIFSLMNYVKENNLTCIVIGHVNKEGTIAGPKVLEHMVDTVLLLEGDKNSNLRLLKSIKNRFGTSNEIGLFQMHKEGLIESSNNIIQLKQNKQHLPGSVSTCFREGSRVFYIEVQSLVIVNKFGTPKRASTVIENRRLSVLLAIIEKFLGIVVSDSDIFLDTNGGLKIINRDADLAIIASLISSIKNKQVPNTWFFIGDVGLNAEVGSVADIEKRLSELREIGCKKLFLSSEQAKTIKDNQGFEVIGIKNVLGLNKYIN